MKGEAKNSFEIREAIISSKPRIVSKKEKHRGVSDGLGNDVDDGLHDLDFVGLMATVAV